MFESLSLLSLQQYWWLIVSLLGALFVFLMFVQGGETLFFTIAKNEEEKSLLVNTLGRKWEFTFTTLVTFGGAFFASFPLFYATSFGGAYWVWFAILISFVIQAVSYEFRKKPDNFLGAKTYETFLFINGLLGPLLVGTAVGTFFNGAMFSLDDMKHVTWGTEFRGLEAVLTFHNLALGFAVVFLSRILGLLYFMNSIDSEAIYERSKKQLLYNTVPFLVFFLYFVIALLFKDGFAYNPTSGEISIESYKYLHNLLAIPVNTLMLLIGVVGVLWGIGSTILKGGTKGIWFVGGGTVLTVWALLILAAFNNTSFYPSIFDMQSSLTIENASSSKFTLVAMSYVSLFVPFVLGYIWYAWKSMNNEKISTKELEQEHHVY
ncbi:cytochrome d ubiquinol oxidase subunit II [Aquipluma nitroreducens]|uniref:Cytochrome d ubiquinol oxidase subunit II n=1 Tax=Aquipluma nitroreducens TaxID=2010828 RepID=A0A5K7S527_9BACT|nr:cytochrome d ubiquinol oxidase subunit II [Aquipluma nitroreducens]BBE16607.1 cytochrome d ubiquinol oxidase subunit II [Aquipluma nitroreducens]